MTTRTHESDLIIRSLHVFLVVVASVTAAPTALACSVIGHYVRPTNFELVQMADAIVVASTLAPTAGDQQDQVRFRTLESIKGHGPSEFYVSGQLGKPMPSDPRELAEPNPDAYAGPCIRSTFAKSKAYVIFLKQDDDSQFSQLGYPFTRPNEDYFGPASLWVRTIKAYLDVQQRLPAMEQLAELERLMMSARSSAKPDDRKFANDIVNHLQSRSPYKPTEYLLATYEALERGETPKFALRAPSEDREKSVAQDLTDSLFGTGVPSKLGRTEQMEFVLTSLVEGSHAGAAGLFERLITAETTSPRKFGLALRFLAKNGQFERAFDVMRTHGLALLPQLPAKDAAGLIQDIALAMGGEDSLKGNERWRSHPRIAAQWPELALRLYWYQQRAFGPDHTISFDDAIDSLAVTDYRSRPELTLALAKNFDSDVESWAIAELLGKEPVLTTATVSEEDEGGANFEKDPAFLPIQALVLAYGEERNAAILDVFCQNKNRRGLLIRALGRWADTLDEGLIIRMISSPILTAEERDLFGMALAELYGAQADLARRFGSVGGWFDLGPDWYALLKGLLQDQVQAKDPLLCPAAKPAG